MKLRENNFKGDSQKYYEIHAIDSDKAIGLHILLGSYATAWSQNVRVCVALK